MTLRDKLLSYYGLTEIPGEKNNPVIMGFFKNLGHSWVQNDETSWCAAAIGSCAKDIGLEYSRKLDARSYRIVGAPYDPPEDGISWDPNVVCIHWRVSINDWRGHVSHPIRWMKNENNIWVLGGNQSNQMKISPYPIEGNNSGVLEFRKLRML